MKTPYSARPGRKEPGNCESQLKFDGGHHVFKKLQN